MEFMKIPWNSIEFHVSIEFHGIPLNSMEFHGKIE
jgi:hypothetical protein